MHFSLRLGQLKRSGSATKGIQNLKNRCEVERTEMIIEVLQARLAHMHFRILMRSTSATHDSTILAHRASQTHRYRYIRKKLTRRQKSLPKKGVEKLDKEKRPKTALRRMKDRRLS